MCFGDRSVKGGNDASNTADNLNSRPVKINSTPSKTANMPESYAPPPGPPPNHQSGSGSEYTPPPGPPPGKGNNEDQYAPPAGPPPGHQSRTEEFAPPPGPPPGHEEYAPPPGPPPSQHDWQTAVPDTSLLPPPPALGDDRSPTNNATEADAKRAEDWLRNKPIDPPRSFDKQALEQLESGDISLIAPPKYGDLKAISRGRWQGRSRRGSPDSCIFSATPLYVVSAQSPLQTGQEKTIYFEVRILPGSRQEEVSLGLGFVAQPYPPFRLPGWERASLGVHGDDGHRYINDKWGGKEFTAPFKPGQTLGIGMRFSKRVLDQPPAYEGRAQTTATTPINVDVFFTRNGKIDGKWNLHEEADASQDLPVTGLEGLHDLYAAVGTFEAVEFQVNFDRKDWLYKP